MNMNRKHAVTARIVYVSRVSIVCATAFLETNLYFKELKEEKEKLKMNMLPNYIINRMTEDELRNYITHVKRVFDDQRDVIVADGYLVETLERVYRHRCHLGDCLSQLNISQDCLDHIQDELIEKYAKPDDSGTTGAYYESDTKRETENE